MFVVMCLSGRVLVMTASFSLVVANVPGECNVQRLITVKSLLTSTVTRKPLSKSFYFRKSYRVMLIALCFLIGFVCLVYIKERKKTCR